MTPVNRAAPARSRKKLRGRAAAGRRTLVWLALAALFLVACGAQPAAPEHTAAPAPALTATVSAAPPATPTATEAPLAARVNGRPVPLEAFQREVVRYEIAQRALGADLAALGDYRARVLEDLVRRELVLEIAEREGVAVAEPETQAGWDAAVAAAGGQGAFDAWLAAQGYLPDEFRQEMRVALIAQALAARVAPVPATAEQVHARHIVVATEAEAQTVLALLQGGSDFADLARRYSRDLSTRLSGGELGWFYRGALTVPEVEDAAFNLQPNAISGIVPSAIGFHLVQTLERDPARALDAAALAALRQQAFADWLAAQRARADVELLIQ